MVLVGYFAISALLNGCLDIYRKFAISKEIPIRSFVQVAKLILFVITAIILMSILLDKNPIYFLSGLGAITAVLMLIFKDAILGLVAGVQLAANRMVARGDWIEMPKYGADGNVVDIALTTVKVQNWDNTITTVPTYALISDSFKNWRGMQESGGRRIKRSLKIDINTVRFCDEAHLKELRKIDLLSDYLKEREAEIAKERSAHKGSGDHHINARALTNLGTFRAYVRAYVKNHPLIHQELTVLVRQLASTENGLPLEIYVFSKDKDWVAYEGLQADIFEHVFAILPAFKLRAFQRGTDYPPPSN
jgi:miniconductance mechanosensitive channel